MVIHSCNILLLPDQFTYLLYLWLLGPNPILKHPSNLKTESSHLTKSSHQSHPTPTKWSQESNSQREIIHIKEGELNIGKNSKISGEMKHPRAWRHARPGHRASNHWLLALGLGIVPIWMVKWSHWRRSGSNFRCKCAGTWGWHRLARSFHGC